MKAILKALLVMLALCCGEANPYFLSIDHIAGDGGEKRKQPGGDVVSGENGYRRLRHLGGIPMTFNSSAITAILRRAALDSVRILASPFRCLSSTILRHTVLCAAFLCVASVPAFGTKISVQSETINGIYFPGVSVTNPPHVRVFANKPFHENVNHQLVPNGAPNAGGMSSAYLDITTSYTPTGGVVVVPPFTLDSTDDALDDRTATFSFFWYIGQSYAGPIAGMNSLVIFHSIASSVGCSPASTCAFWVDLRLSNFGLIAPSNPTATYSAPVIDQKINAAVGMATGIHDPGSNGLLSRTAMNSVTPRSIVSGSIPNLTVSNGDGTAGNPTISLGFTPYTDPTITAGDIAIRNASNVVSRLAATSNGFVLTLSGGVPAWAAAPSGFADPLTTRGDIIFRNSSNATSRLATGAANTVLQSNGTDPSYGLLNKAMFPTSGQVFATLSNALTTDSAYGSDQYKVLAIQRGTSGMASDLSASPTINVQIHQRPSIGSNTLFNYSFTTHAHGSALVNDGDFAALYNLVSTIDTDAPTSFSGFHRDIVAIAGRTNVIAGSSAHAFAFYGENATSSTTGSAISEIQAQNASGATAGTIANGLAPFTGGWSIVGVVSGAGSLNNTAGLIFSTSSSAGKFWDGIYFYANTIAPTGTAINLTGVNGGAKPILLPQAASIYGVGASANVSLIQSAASGNSVVLGADGSMVGIGGTPNRLFEVIGNANPGIRITNTAITGNPGFMWYLRDGSGSGLLSGRQFSLFDETTTADRILIDASGFMQLTSGRLGPTLAQAHTIPAVTADTYTLLAATQILTNKSIGADLRWNDTGSGYTGFQAPTTMAANVIYKLPTNDGTAGQVIKTDGSKNLSWANNLSGGAPTTSLYGLLAADFNLPNARILTGTASQITLTDNGAGSTLVFSIPSPLSITSIVGGSAVGSSTTILGTSNGSPVNAHIFLNSTFADGAGAVVIGGTSTVPFGYRLDIQAQSTNLLRIVNANAIPGAGGGAGIQAGITTLPTAADQRLAFYTFGAGNAVSSGLVNGALMSGWSGEVYPDAITAHGTYIKIETTPVGLTSRAEHFRISPQGVGNFFNGANVASAASISITGNSFHVTGTTTVTSIATTAADGSVIVAGTRITIIFDGVLTFTDGSNLKLAGNFVTTADDTITLVFDGTSWFEAARSIN